MTTASQIQFHVQDSIEWTPGLERFARAQLWAHTERLMRAGGVYGPWRLDIHLRDERGARGGVDQICRCVLTRALGPPIIVTEKAADIRTAIHRCRQRLARRVRDGRSTWHEARRRIRPVELTPPVTIAFDLQET